MCTVKPTTLPYTTGTFLLCCLLLLSRLSLSAQATLPPDMVFVQGGTFVMGCTAEQQPDCYSLENPAHEVTLTDFYMGKYEVTQGQWEALFGANPSNFSSCGTNCPVENVSWFDAAVFCNRLSEQAGYNPCYYADAGYMQVYGKNGSIWSLPNTGTVFWKLDANGYRLPTEAEWEYAARGGSLSKGYKYSGNNNIGDVAWYNSNSSNTTHAVGTKTANELGLFDLSGNVWEWCYDWHSSSYYAISPACAPLGPEGGSLYKVDRGGSWLNVAVYTRTAARLDFSPPPSRAYDLGFRLCRTP